ncbi:hypothetical protein [Streptomyces sp. NPDC091215]|uniref:hypothetical protein n=1 Tax=Streptomyces sp. NPDC091215 TaxID=3155192 RepID=UPI003447478C
MRALSSPVPNPFTAAAFGAMAVALLAGCGGGGGGGGADANAGVGSSEAVPSVSASPAASRPTAAGRPEITFPSGARNVFEGTKTGDAAKDAVLADSALGVNSMDEAIFKQSTGTKALGFYNADKALGAAITYVQGYIDKGDTWIGETRYFDRKVTLSGVKDAYVTYCSDESKSFLKNRKTGKVKNTPTTAASYVLYHTKLTKNARGIWQTTGIVSNRGDKTCRP